MTKGALNKNLMNLMRVKDLSTRKLLFTEENAFFAANKVNVNINLDGVYDFYNEIYAISGYAEAMNELSKSKHTVS